jgi:hypothetical protein
MPRPSRLRLSPLLDIFYQLSTEDVPLPSLSSNVAVSDHSFSASVDVRIYLVLFQVLWTIRVVVIVTIYWIDSPEEGSPTSHYDASSSPATSTSPLPVIVAPMNIPDQETDRSSDSPPPSPTQEAETFLSESSSAEMPETNTSEEPMPPQQSVRRRPTPYPAYNALAPDEPIVPTPLPPSSSDNAAGASTSQTWQDARRAATLSYPSTVSAQPENSHDASLKLIQACPQINLNPETPPVDSTAKGEDLEPQLLNRRLPEDRLLVRPPLLKFLLPPQ